MVNPSTLTADGASTAAITVTVLTSGTLQTPVQGVTLTGILSPGTLGEIITPFGLTDSNGQASSTWRAGTVAGSGQLIVGDGSVTRTANITLVPGAPYTVTLSQPHIAVCQEWCAKQYYGYGH